MNGNGRKFQYFVLVTFALVAILMFANVGESGTQFLNFIEQLAGGGAIFFVVHLPGALHDLGVSLIYWAGWALNFAISTTILFLWIGWSMLLGMVFLAIHTVHNKSFSIRDYTLGGIAGTLLIYVLNSIVTVLITFGEQLLSWLMFFNTGSAPSAQQISTFMLVLHIAVFWIMYTGILYPIRRLFMSESTSDCNEMSD